MSYQNYAPASNMYQYNESLYSPISEASDTPDVTIPEPVWEMQLGFETNKENQADPGCSRTKPQCLLPSPPTSSREELNTPVHFNFDKQQTTSQRQDDDFDSPPMSEFSFDFLQRPTTNLPTIRVLPSVNNASQQNIKSPNEYLSKNDVIPAAAANTLNCAYAGPQVETQQFSYMPENNMSTSGYEQTFNYAYFGQQVGETFNSSYAGQQIQTQQVSRMAMNEMAPTDGRQRLQHPLNQHYYQNHQLIMQQLQNQLQMCNYSQIMMNPQFGVQNQQMHYYQPQLQNAAAPRIHNNSVSVPAANFPTTNTKCQKTTATKRSNRTIYTSHQLLELESQFSKNMFLCRSERTKLSKLINVDETKIKVWFQNRRVKATKAAKAAKPC